MNSVEQQILLQYLEALRQEQKKTSEIITGVGAVLLIVGLFILWSIQFMYSLNVCNHGVHMKDRCDKCGRTESFPVRRGAK